MITRAFIWRGSRRSQWQTIRVVWLPNETDNTLYLCCKLVSPNTPHCLPTVWLSLVNHHLRRSLWKSTRSIFLDAYKRGSAGCSIKAKLQDPINKAHGLVWTPVNSDSSRSPTETLHKCSITAIWTQMHNKRPRGPDILLALLPDKNTIYLYGYWQCS